MAYCIATFKEEKILKVYFCFYRFIPDAECQINSKFLIGWFRELPVAKVL